MDACHGQRILDWNGVFIIGDFLRRSGKLCVSIMLRVVGVSMQASPTHSPFRERVTNICKIDSKIYLYYCSVPYRYGLLLLDIGE